MKIYFWEFLVNQHRFHLPLWVYERLGFSLLLSLTSCAASLCFSLFVFSSVLCDLLTAFVSADEFASVILTSLSLWLRMVGTHMFSWLRWYLGLQLAQKIISNHKFFNHRAICSFSNLIML